MNKIIILVTFFCYLSGNTFAQSVNLNSFSAGYNWLIGFESTPGDEDLFVFQKDGFIKRCNPDGTIDPTPFLDLSAKVNNAFDNEQGLLGLAFHPDYEINGRFFVFYNEIGTGVCTIARFERDATNPAIADPTSETELLTWSHPLGNHVGGCLQFGPDGYLYIGSGDGGGAGDPDGNGQNLDTYLGKLLRIDVNGGATYTVPPDNPFIATADAKPEIFAYGLRNPWRFSFDPITGNGWIGDVGQNEKEEVNFIPAGNSGGQNFGWSCMEGTQSFNTSQCLPGVPLTDPIYEYQNSLSSGDCSITGGVVYRGSKYADLFGKYIFTDFCSGHIWALTLNNDTVESVVELGDFDNNNYTALNAGPDGELYVTGFFSNEISQLKSDDCTPVAWITNPSSVSLDGGPVTLEAYPGNNFSYQWLMNGNEVPGGNDPNLIISESGIYTVFITNQENGCTNISNAIEASSTGEAVIIGQGEVCENSSHYYETNTFAGATYEWSVTEGTLLDGQGTSEAFVLWNDEGIGQLELTVTLSDGTMLTGENFVEILVNDLSLTAEFSEGICPGENNGLIALTVTGTGNQIEYNWNTGATSEVIFNLEPGAYKVTVTNELGCQVNDGYLLFEAPLPTVEFEIEPENCFGLGSFSGTATSPPCGIWETFSLEEISAGNYAVTVTDCYGCNSIYEVEVPLIMSAPLFNINISNPSPGQSDGEIIITPIGDYQPYTYEWNNGATDSLLTDLPAGNYSITVTDINGCATETTLILMDEINATDEHLLTQNIKTFPNPTAGEFNLEFILPQAKIMSVDLLDVTGKKIKTLFPETQLNTGEQQLKLNLKSRPSGIYFLEIKIGEEIISKKIVLE